MTPAGHLLTGVAIGIACAPKGMTRRGRAGFLAACAVLALAPDWPLPCWGHAYGWYFFSHSLFVNLLCMGVMGALAWCFLPRAGRWPLLLGGALAWLSHLLLDSFYNGGHGVAIGWPFSEGRLVLPIPWFAALRQPGLNLSTLRIMAIETLCYLPLPVLALGVHRLRAARKNVAPLQRTTANTGV